MTKENNIKKLKGNVKNLINRKLKVKLFYLSIGIIITLFLINLTNAGLITFNNVENISRILYYNGNNTVLISHQANNFSLFRDNVGVNNSLYFGYNGGTFNNITINITNPVVATSFGVLWQYNTHPYYFEYWKNLSNVVDNTNNFSITGTNTISFDIPSLWVPFEDSYAIGRTFSTTTRIYYVRAYVISSVSPTSGGNATGNQTTIRDNTITVTGLGNTIETLYSQSLTSNWGAVTNLGSYYFINANLKIGNATNTPHELTIKNWGMVELGNATRFVLLRSIHSNCSLILGNITANETYESSYFKYWNGGQYYYGGSYNNLYNLHLYSSTFIKNRGSYLDFKMFSPEFINSVFQHITSGHEIFIDQPTGIDAGIIKDSQIATPRAWFYLYSSTIQISNLVISRNWGILAAATTAITNIDFGRNKNFTMSGGYTGTCVDCTFYNITSQLQTTLGNTNTLNYTLTIDIYNKTGERIYPNISIIDSSGRTQFNGAWINFTQVQTYKKNNTGNFSYNPFIITLQHNGMINYKTNISINNLNKYLSITMGYYPFEINGTLVISNGKGVKIYK